jgi:hypothetical protein
MMSRPRTASNAFFTALFLAWHQAPYRARRQRVPCAEAWREKGVPYNKLDRVPLLPIGQEVVHPQDVERRPVEAVPLAVLGHLDIALHLLERLALRNA